MRRKTKISPLPIDERPYSHLEPMVDALLESGNRTVGSKFYLDQDGWRSDLEKPINFKLIEETFELPKSIVLSRGNDSILCHNTWIEIKGPIGR